MDQNEALTKLKDAVEHLTHRSIDEQLFQDSVAAMICALIETHPDKDALHVSFSRIYQAMGCTERAVLALGQGKQGSISVIGAFSQAMQRELP